MCTLENAIRIAAIAHAGQRDKADQPYILHQLKVMLRLDGEHARMAAMLQDVVSDGGVSLAELVAEGFPDEVVEAVRLLTRRAGENRLDAAHRCAQHRIARQVKLADNAENMDPSRLIQPSERDLARLDEYRQVRLILLAAGVP